MRGHLVRSNSWSAPLLPAHLYVHWPFCARRCAYCDFVALAQHDSFVHRYHKALVEELQAFAQCSHERWRLKTVYIGGGTPSLWPLPLVTDFFEQLTQVAHVERDAEITIECNPTGVTDAQLKTWRACGINRLSLGVQILDDHINKSLNRPQRSEDVERIVASAAGLFENLSIDLIVGLPGTTDSLWQQTIDRVLSWPVKHVSIYLLTVYEHTPLFHAVQRGALALPGDEQVVAWFDAGCKWLNSAGFERYEISNFAKVGYASLHNKAYWDRTPFKGIGLSASSFDGAMRFTNEKRLAVYLDRSASCAGAESVTPTQEVTERVMLGLRQSTGIMLSSFKAWQGGANGALVAELRALEGEGLLMFDGERVALTSRGMMVENELTLRMLRYLTIN